MQQSITALPELPVRPADSHKGTFGRVLIVAGSPGMSGAAALAGMGALRGGAGLVFVAAPASILPIVAAVEPSYLTVPLSVDQDGHLSDAALGEVWAAIDGKNACGLGSGMGARGITSEVILSLYTDAELPMVIDADALNCLAKNSDLFKQHSGPRLLTPHPGEFARMLRCDIAEVQAHREKLAIRFAEENQVVLVLKGSGTVVTDGARVYINTTGNSGMATGGTGDVLTGLMTALLAQKMEPFEAAQLAVYMHGCAGDLAASQFSQPGLIASDLPQALCRIWLMLQQQQPL